MTPEFVPAHDGACPVGAHWLDHAIAEALEDVSATRQTIVEAVGAPRTTVYDRLVKLEAAGHVKRTREVGGRRGRPRVLWMLLNSPPPRLSVSPREYLLEYLRRRLPHAHAATFLADVAGIRRETCKRYLRELISEGVVVVVKRAGGRRRYKARAVVDR